MSQYLNEAKRNGDGDLIYDKVVPLPGGGSTTEPVNMTTLYRPGVRKTARVDRLVEEARLVADGVELENPLRPSTDTAAKDAVERLEELELTPAWRTADEVTYP